MKYKWFGVLEKLPPVKKIFLYYQRTYWLSSIPGFILKRIIRIVKEFGIMKKIISHSKIMLLSGVRQQYEK